MNISNTLSVFIFMRYDRSPVSYTGAHLIDALLIKIMKIILILYVVVSQIVVIITP